MPRDHRTRDPYSAVRDMGGRGIVATVAFSTFAHVAFAAAVGLAIFGVARGVRAEGAPARAEYEVDVNPVEPAREAEPQKTEEAQSPPQQPAQVAKSTSVPQKAAPLAKAGAALTSDNPYADDRNTIVTGSGNAHAGGASSPEGTSEAPVRTVPAVTAVAPVAPPPVVAPPPPPSIDRSRAAAPARSGWQCPFPAEADRQQIDEAVVTVRVVVGANGAPLKVSVLSDPGVGFGSAAVRCAMSQKFFAGLDRDGNAAVTTTAPLNVHFER